MGHWLIDCCFPLLVVVYGIIGVHQGLHLRVHNIVLYLWVVSPRVSSDASMVMETTMRTIEYAVGVCREQGVVCPDQLMIWDPWIEFSCLGLPPKLSFNGQN